MIRIAFFLVAFIVIIKAQSQFKAESLPQQQNLYAGDWLVKPVIQ
jgi:hypothetical protein